MPDSSGPGLIEALGPSFPPPDAPAVMLRELFRGWLYLLGGLLLGPALVLLALNGVEPEYTAQMTVGPTARTGAAGMGARIPANQGPGTRTLAEPGTGEELLSDFTRFTSLLTALPLAERLARDPEVMTKLFSESWDEEAQRWIPPPGLVPGAKRLVLRLAGRTPWVPPDARDVARRLRNDLWVEPTGPGPLHRIAFRHPDPDFAVRLITRIHRLADGLIREQAEIRISAGIDHLKSRRQAQPVLEHRNILADLQSDHELMHIMLDIDLPFAADLIEPATAPALPDWPNPLVLVPLGGMAGLMTGLFLAYARAAWRLGLLGRGWQP